MDINKKLQILQIAEDGLTALKIKPFQCLQAAASLYAVLNDSYNIEAKLVTGNLLFKDNYIFKQDFSLSTAESDKLQLWAGHAWVEIEEMLLDLSFFKTLYSDKFNSRLKAELLEAWGPNQQFIICDAHYIPAKNIRYEPIDILSDDMATSIIKGIDLMP